MPDAFAAALPAGARPAEGARALERRAGLYGMATSLALHALVVALIVVRWPQARAPDMELPEPVTVEFVVEEAKPAPASEAVEKPAPAPAENLEIRERAEAGRIPVPETKPAPPAEAVPARPRIEAVPREKPAPPTRFDPGRVAALLDKARKESPPAGPAEERAEAKPDAARDALKDRIAVASLSAALAARVQRCWTAPVGAKGVEDMLGRIEVRLSREGRLVGLPRFVDVDEARLKTDPYYRVFVESARRAVLACAPYDDLPQPLYRLWQQIEFTFSPKNMY